MAAKWEITSEQRRDLTKFYYFHLKAANGKIVLQSETYDTKKAALKGIKSIQHNANAQIVDKTKGE